MLFGTGSLRRRFISSGAGPEKSIYDFLEAHREELLASTSHTTKRGFMRALLKLAKPYYWDQTDTKEKALAWTLLVASVGLTYYNVSDIAMGFTELNKQLFNLLQSGAGAALKGADVLAATNEKYEAVMTGAMWLLTKATAVGFLNYKIGESAALRWRKWMTEDYKRLWIDNRAYLDMQHLDNPIDNPDQRIHEDPKAIPDFAFKLTKEALDAALSVVLFSYLLWEKSETENFLGMDIPKFMFAFVITYALLGSGITKYFSKPLEKKNADQQMYEGSFRAALRTVYERAESIALNRMENLHKGILSEKFTLAYNNYKSIININAALDVLKIVYRRLGGLVPIIVTFPGITQGKITIGDVSEVANAFGEVQGGLGFYVNNASNIKTATAYMNRLIAIRDVLEEIEAKRLSGDISVVQSLPPQEEPGMPGEHIPGQAPQQHEHPGPMA